MHTTEPLVPRKRRTRRGATIIALACFAVALPATVSGGAGSGHRRFSSCLPSDAALTSLVSWTKHTVADTSWYAKLNRGRSGVPRISPDSITAVSVDSVCASLAARFARLATARDTISPAAVYVVAVGSWGFLATDYLPGATPSIQVVGDTIKEYNGPQWTQALTYIPSSDSSSIWKWIYSEGIRTPY